ncbi:DedA family protein [Pseudarthrobacter sp. NamE5]|uniref:DedA family protein n=1 Tax=Pseudarthrobacter sp. NamE5 TaxID=2576839 RepID=UPI00110B5111|nr:DedA family protein [Pseudarthrobacter sp. NamE5]TLM80748.1 DedA family protein [Pseudarthrobacter sp. NamE5]
MNGFIDGILGASPVLAYTLVACLIFAEDALFIGFVIPGETAAVLGGVAASRGEAHLGLMMTLVIVAAVVGDSVGYEVGKHVGPRIFDSRPVRRHRRKLDNAQEFLRRRGGSAIFLGRFVAFFRAVMPALAGSSGMEYRRFLAFNLAGGAVWGAGFVLLGYVAGSSYETIAKVAGRDVSATVFVLAIVGIILSRVLSARNRRRNEDRGKQ